MLDHGRKHLVARLLLVRQAASADDPAAARRDEVRHLSAEARLPDSGRAEDRDQLGTTLTDAPVPQRPNELELAIATNERVRGDRALGGLDGGCDREPGLERLGLSLRLDGLEHLVPKRMPGGAVRLLPDDQPTGGSGRLQPRCGVDDVSRRKRLRRRQRRA